jgi:hypothetical protein
LDEELGVVVTAGGDAAAGCDTRVGSTVVGLVAVLDSAESAVAAGVQARTTAAEIGTASAARRQRRQREVGCVVVSLAIRL